MAFVDVTVPYASVQGGGVAASVGGAPTGGGVASAIPLRGSQPGAQGAGTNVEHRKWVLAFYGFIAVVLIWAGVIFNPKR